MSPGELLVTVVTGLVINECCDVSPWAARRLAVRAARIRHHTNPGRVAVRSEEWAAIIDDRPGKLFKLTTALGLAVAAVAHRVRTRRVRGRTRNAPSLLTAALRRRLGAAGLSACVAGLFCGGVGAAAQGIADPSEVWVISTLLATGAGLVGLVERLRPVVVPVGLAGSIACGLTLLWLGFMGGEPVDEVLSFPIALAAAVWLSTVAASRFAASITRTASAMLFARLAVISAVGVVWLNKVASGEVWPDAIVGFATVGLTIGFAGRLGVAVSRLVLPPSPRGPSDPTSTGDSIPAMSGSGSA